ncbi:MAG TPA: acyltransferase [Stellaceae bacterium]|jgi:peptidoglycan/LPS O-acetylase OafA/YrhL|nr:acyltransferase [Stellaceae bacterium]
MRRDNNFDALRLLAAASVLFSHSFIIAEGTQDREPLILLTHRQCILGLVGVFVFFAISGFLVTQSFETSETPLRYLAKRVLRILPGLFAALLISAFVIGASVTTLPLADYLRHPRVFGYVVGNAMLNLTIHELPGVVFVNNPVGLEINGSLWTLRYEFMMYLMVMLLGMLRLLTPLVSAGLLVLGLLCLRWHGLDGLGGWGWLLGFFASGMLLYTLRDRRIFDGRIALAALAGLILSVPLRQFIELFPIFGGYLAIYLALDRRLAILPATRFGDLSYGLYIYGWPIEVSVMYWSGGRAAWWEIFLIALPLATLAAFLSWHFVEEPMLRLKPRRRPAPVSAPAALSPDLHSPDHLPRPG